jgi:CRISPR-associated protein Csb1
MMTTAALLTFEDLAAAVHGAGVALRAITELEPVGGPTDKVFPPTYQGGRYHLEKRRVDGSEVDTVVLDSVQSQANRMELALLEARDHGVIEFPLLVADFSNELPHIGRITALEAPHRIADAIFRDSLLDGVPFRDSDPGKRFTSVSVRDATALLELCPTALLFGVWDSTGPRGGLGVKFARALVSEIVGFDAVTGHRTGSRIDPLPISDTPVYRAENDGYTTNPERAGKDAKGNPELYVGKSKRGAGKPSAVNLGNVPPDFARITDEMAGSNRDLRAGDVLPGGVTISRAVQTSVLSLAGLRKLGFPVDGTRSREADDAARTLLAALGVAAIAFHREHGYDLRSRCLLVPREPLALELVSPNGGESMPFGVDSATAAALVAQAADEVKSAGFRWSGDEIVLVPERKLVDLVKRSEELLAENAGGG